MKYIVSITVGLICLASSVSAAVDGFAKVLSATGAGNGYTVPTGKVLILQQVSLPQGSGVAATVFVLTPGSSSATVTMPGANTNGIYRFQTPLYLPEGTIAYASAANTCLFGLLVDVSDMPLFAGLGSSLGNVTLVANTMTGIIRLPTSDPVVVRFQSSTDLVNWQYDSSVLVQRGPDKMKLQFTVPVSGTGRFYRALVHRRYNA
jgi:hypothetical protein